MGILLQLHQLPFKRHKEIDNNNNNNKLEFHPSGKISFAFA